MVRNKPFKRRPLNAFGLGRSDDFRPVFIVYGATSAHFAGSFIAASNIMCERLDGLPSVHKVSHRFG